MSLWMNYLAYDIMGEVVFGRGFNMLTDTKLHYMLPLIDDMVFSMLLVRTFESIVDEFSKINLQGGVIPEFHKYGVIDLIFPKIAKGRMHFIREAESRILERIEEGESELNDRKDFFYHVSWRHNSILVLANHFDSC